MRNTIIAGNWKMNKTPQQAAELIDALKPLIAGAACEVVICPPFIDLVAAADGTKGSEIKVGAQNCHFETSGAYTGEVSPVMLKAAGMEYVILGHSERRQLFLETDTVVAKKVEAALAAGLRVILCVGETLAQRENGETEAVCAQQVGAALKAVSPANMAGVVIAYEPVWAIGTGKTATAQQADEVCGHIRALVENRYNAGIAQALSILYGGSMNPQNAAELLSMTHVDGGLIGGASLKAEDFAAIVKAGSQRAEGQR